MWILFLKKKYANLLFTIRITSKGALARNSKSIVYYPYLTRVRDRVGLTFHDFVINCVQLCTYCIPIL